MPTHPRSRHSARAPRAPRTRRTRRAPARTRARTAPRKTTARRPRAHRGAYASIGSAIGGAIGGPFGAAVGGAAGSLLSIIRGHGDYTVDRNSIMSNAVPSFSRGGDGVRICHREFISDIGGTSAFSVSSYAINPGWGTVFPWLSTIATGFEEYRMNGLVFEYRPTSGTAVSSSDAALGVVVYATNYDVIDPAFASKQEMESYEFSSSSVPFEGMLHPVECAPSRNPLDTLYVRNGGVPSGTDQRLYDMGLFQVGTQGMQSAYTVGELWVSYDVSFKKPRINPVSSDDTYVTYALINETPAASATAASPLGTKPVVSSESTLYTILTASSFTLNIQGTYLISACWVGASITGNASYSVGANLSQPTYLLQNYSSPTATRATNSSNNATLVGIISVVTDGGTTANTVTLTGPTSLSGGSCTLVISLLPGGVTP